MAVNKKATLTIPRPVGAEWEEGVEKSKSQKVEEYRDLRTSLPAGLTPVREAGREQGFTI